MSVSELSSGSNIKKSSIEKLEQKIETLNENMTKMATEIVTLKGNAAAKGKTKSKWIPKDQFIGSSKHKESMRKKNRQKLLRQRRRRAKYPEGKHLQKEENTPNDSKKKTFVKHVCWRNSVSGIL